MGDVRPGNGAIANGRNALETINAAATAFENNETASAAAVIQKRRWTSCWSIYWCFGYQKQRNRVGDAVQVPHTTASGINPSSAEGLTTVEPAISTPILAPPSSPASFLPSEPSSAAQSPGGAQSLISVSANIYSPVGPRSIFAFGPYAHETQLVSPPVFSSFNTEPSTAPFTPPPESLHFTTPSSPEVPFAQLLDRHHITEDLSPRIPSSRYEFLSYQLHPGSPVGQLISPGSAISRSGASTPFPDFELYACGPYFPDLQLRVHPMHRLPSERGSLQGSGSLTPDAVWPISRDSLVLERQDSTVSPLPEFPNRSQKSKLVIDHRFSFELSAEEVRCVAKELIASSKALQRITTTTQEDENSSDLVPQSKAVETSSVVAGDAEDKVEDGERCQRQRSTSLGSQKEFNFDNSNEERLQASTVRSYWWANEKVVAKEGESSEDWSFFPINQPDVG
ncbi:hypothetical protein AKJ16_DCAP22881 [Drosera capensis]